MNELSPSAAVLKAARGFINGQWVEADSGGTIDVINPADGSVVGRAPNMGAAETERAIAAASAALPAWRALAARQRSLLLRRWHDLVLVFVDALVKAVATLKVGAGAEEGTTIGPLINMAAVEKVERHIADAQTKGGVVILGGRRHARGGTFFQLTIITGANASMMLAQDETFGPVAPLFRFKTEEGSNSPTTPITVSRPISSRAIWIGCGVSRAPSRPEWSASTKA